MAARPDRSDARLSPEAEAAREAEVRGYFDGAAPKRHTKPSRSDHSAVYADALVPDNSHPELDKFQELEAQTEVSLSHPSPHRSPARLCFIQMPGQRASEQLVCDVPVVVSFQKLVYEGGKTSEEFVETEYYKDLGCVGKQHHTVTAHLLIFALSYSFYIRTGTGFIQMDKSNGGSFELHEDRDGTERHASCKGNPATNEWIPSADTVGQILAGSSLYVCVGISVFDHEANTMYKFCSKSSSVTSSSLFILQVYPTSDKPGRSDS
ncbi:hypothetical protein PR202_ga26262 [Eleusine coracana subsp. coracana]|uniref:Uncharacterized protein n=1 Tax=Eleusine coracana subsp. coracana TaxID=191504 RepID=A0AAV5DDN3_ELECO|nr:hypothetical protein PR202_ga26262 [Eleusine coracana subsp. coracana]